MLELEETQRNWAVLEQSKVAFSHAIHNEVAFQTDHIKSPCIVPETKTEGSTE